MSDVPDLGTRPLFRFLSEDHQRLDEILRRATAIPGCVDFALFEEFRGGLLRHIGMEEKVLLPAARRARGGEPLRMARRIRREHGALAAMLVPTPTPARVEQLLSVLTPHNALEEKTGGVYDICERLLVHEAPTLLEELRAFPTVPLAPHHDSPFVERHIAETLALARRAETSD